MIFSIIKARFVLLSHVGSTAMLGAQPLQAALAGDVEFNAVPDDVSGDVVPNGAEQPFNRGGTEFADGAAFDAYRVVVVLDSGKAVHGGAIQQGELADYPRIQQKLDRAVYRRPADRGQLLADLLGAESMLLAL